MSAPVLDREAPPPVPAAGASAGALAAVRAARDTGARRRRLVVAVLTVAVLVVVGVALSYGARIASPLDVVRIVAGQDVPGLTFIVHELRLPRVLTGLCVGLALGAAGALTQTLLRNPLASPDILGISAGASAAAVVSLLVFGWSRTATAGAAFVGALLTAVVILLLARRGTISGYRFILVGIGVGALLSSVVSYMLTRVELQEAQAALLWVTGSLNSASWDRLPALVVPLAVLLPLAALLARPLGVLQLGDDLATSLGARVDRARVLVIVVAVALAAIATAAAGPVAFVAFLAGPLARRLTRGPGPALAASALVGALLVLVGDLLGQHLLGTTRLPVGVVTGVVGAPYLLWLIAAANRSGKGG